MSVIEPEVGPYRVESLLGRGGMGVVYRAVDTRTGAVVALKTLPHARPDALLRFKQEFRSLSDISHPNLASLYELISVDGAWHLAMEFVDGTDLLNHIRGQRVFEPVATASGDEETTDVAVPQVAHMPMGADRAAGLDPQARLSSEQEARLRATFAHLASALDALHANDTLHRDIKPSNVMVDRVGRTVLLDFGLATAISESGASNPRQELLGTIDYMAPEQASSIILTPAADWYAVGVILFRALTGHMPFTGTTGHVLFQKLREPAPSLVTSCPELPRDLCELCDALLERDPLVRATGATVLAHFGVTEWRGRQAGEELLVGREAQSSALRGLLDGLSRGTPAAVFVQGRSGAGKSHLVRHFLAEARAMPDAVVLSGRCYEDESVPYKAVDSLIDSLAHFLNGLRSRERAVLAPRDAAALTRVFPVLRQVRELAESPRHEPDIPDPQELRRRAFRALREMLGRIGDRRRLILHVDDLQWGDADSAALLADLLRPPDPPLFLLLCVYRSEYADRSVCVSTLREALLSQQDARGVAMHTIDVEPLGVDDARALALALLPKATPDGQRRAATIAEEAGGIPFFIHALARHATTDGTTDDDLSSASDLDHVIRRRVAGLPTETRAVLALVAVCGHPITRQVLAAASGSHDRGILRTLRTEHFIRTTGSGDSDWVEPYHDRIREAVTAELPTDVTRGHHARIATTLESPRRSNRRAQRIQRHWRCTSTVAACAIAPDTTIRTRQMRPPASSHSHARRSSMAGR